MTRELPEDLLLSIQPSQVRLYALQAGWRQIQTKNPSVILLNHPTDALEQIRVPLNGNPRDRAYLMYDAISALAENEHRSPREVWNDLILPPSDVLHLRMTSRDAESGTVALNDGLNLFLGGRDLLLAAACSAHQPQPYFPRQSFAPALEFLRNCRLGQTDRESYVVTIMVPVPPELSPPSRVGSPLEDDFSEVPYERRVTILLMLGLRLVREGIDHGQTDRILTNAGQGVSANLCDALLAMAPTDPRGQLQISMRWSRSRPQLSDRVPSHVSFVPTELPVIREASRLLREQALPHPIRVEGRVINLHAEPATLLEPFRGQVIIRALIADQAARVRFPLEEGDYLRACEAHRNRRRISVVGVLHRDTSGNRFAIRHPQGFQILPEQEPLTA